VNLEGEEQPKFPTDVVVRVKLAPGQIFGTEKGLVRAIPFGGNGRVVYNANTGRTGFENSSLSVAKASVALVAGKSGGAGISRMQVDLKGDVLQVKARCRDTREVNAVIYTAHYLIPALMSMELAEPVFVETTGGQIGKQHFRWELATAKVSMQALAADGPSKQAERAFHRMKTLAEHENMRLKAAVHYLHAGRRLLAAGNSLWEFMAEAVLNFCKVIEVLFGQRRDDIRAELKKLGFSEQDIEHDYVPITILRNSFDVGHVRLTVPDATELQFLYEYLCDIERSFCKLIGRLMDRLDKGEYALREYGDSQAEKSSRSEWENLIEGIKGRVKQNVNGSCTSGAE
jgi:hypothetical protein